MWLLSYRGQKRRWVSLISLLFSIERPLLANRDIFCRYFQCVTNPRCDHCWINLTTTSTTTTRPPRLTTLTPITNFLRSDYQTLLPGTYTSSSGGTAHVVIVQQPSQSVSVSVVTATVTNLVTVSAAPFSDASLGSTATVASVDVRRSVRWKRWIGRVLHQNRRMEIAWKVDDL